MRDDSDRKDCRLMSDWPYFELAPPRETVEGVWVPQVVPFAGADGASFVTTAEFSCSLWTEDD